MAKKFFETEVGSVVAMATHDIGNAAGMSIYNLKQFVKQIDAGIKLDLPTLKNELEKVIERQNKINDSVDYLYERIKKLQGY